MPFLHEIWTVNIVATQVTILPRFLQSDKVYGIVFVKWEIVQTAPDIFLAYSIIFLNFIENDFIYS